MELSEIEKANPYMTKFLPRWYQIHSYYTFGRMMHTAGIVSAINSLEVAEEFDLLRDICGILETEEKDNDYEG